MDPLFVGLIAVVLVVVLMILGFHVGIALGLVGFIGFVVLGGIDIGLGILKNTPFFVVASFTFTTLPLYLLMGSFATHAGIAEDLYNTAYKWLERVPGGLAIATMFACAAFGATSGSSVATAAIFAKISLPEMFRKNYEKKFACGVVCSGGILAILIPPSVLLIIYGVITEQPIGKLFIAGIIPGVVLTLIYGAGIWILVTRNPKLAPQPMIRTPWRERINSLRSVWGTIVLAALVIGGIYGGVFTPTEAGATGAFGAFVIALGLRRLSWGKLWDTLLDAAEVTCMVFLIMIGSMIFSRFLVISGVSGRFTEAVTGAGLSSLGVIVGFVVIYLILGCLIEGISILCLTLPVFFPIAMALGVDPIWFGIVAVVATEIGLVTPPVGLNVYIVSAAAGPGVSMEEVFRGCLPFFIMQVFFVGLLVAFPQIATLLPRMMLSGK